MSAYNYFCPEISASTSIKNYILEVEQQQHLFLEMVYPLLCGLFRGTRIVTYYNLISLLNCNFKAIKVIILRVLNGF